MDCNKVYLARALKPDGPWEKWNGSSWGGNPHYVVDYPESSGFGCGEPSMVVVDDTIYLYYNYVHGSRYVRVMTAPSDDPLWPSKLENRGTAMTLSLSHDSPDIKYCEKNGTFYAAFGYNRLKSTSTIMFYSSTDGISFTKLGEMRGEKNAYLHNCGISGDPLGHIDPSKPQAVSYAFGPATGAWDTWLSPLTW